MIKKEAIDPLQAHKITQKQAFERGQEPLNMRRITNIGSFRAYVERKQKLGLLDYDDLLLYWHAMMSEERIAKSVAAHFDHVLVDEYQDTNKLQGDILAALKPDGQGVTVDVTCGTTSALNYKVTPIAFVT